METLLEEEEAPFVEESPALEETLEVALVVALVAVLVVATLLEEDEEPFVEESSALEEGEGALLEAFEEEVTGREEKAELVWLKEDVA